MYCELEVDGRELILLQFYLIYYNYINNESMYIKIKQKKYKKHIHIVFILNILDIREYTASADPVYCCILYYFCIIVLYYIMY